ncbi:hypothetical protein C8R43DRAFT_1118407 [Mycena crocata]|nr:hypothetical protein C8R43DRAFT_1118407 [Mycena crocata]
MEAKYGESTAAPVPSKFWFIVMNYYSGRQHPADSARRLHPRPMDFLEAPNSQSAGPQPVYHYPRTMNFVEPQSMRHHPQAMHSAPAPGVSLSAVLRQPVSVPASSSARPSTEEWLAHLSRQPSGNCVQPMVPSQCAECSGDKYIDYVRERFPGSVPVRPEGYYSGPGPDSLLKDMFFTKTPPTDHDIWKVGVLLTDILTFENTMRHAGAQQLRQVQDGKRLKITGPDEANFQPVKFQTRIYGNCQHWVTTRFNSVWWLAFAVRGFVQDKLNLSIQGLAIRSLLAGEGDVYTASVIWLRKD